METIDILTGVVLAWFVVYCIRAGWWDGKGK